MARRRTPTAPATTSPAGVEAALRLLFDPAWYLRRYPDLAQAGVDPFTHYFRFGAQEGRDPNPFFDGAWYRAHHADAARSGVDPLLHYLSLGAAQGHNPHPRFDAGWYVDQHPEAAGNPLLFHLRTGRSRGFATEPAFDPAAFLPSPASPPRPPAQLVVDVIVPVYRGLAATRRCLASVLEDPERPPGRIIVIDDATPEAELAAWLDGLKAEGRILLLRHARNRGFVASANAGIAAAGRHDVALLNSDTEVPAGWLARLAGHAHAAPRVASVSPLSNNATICGYPTLPGGPPAFGLGVAALDAAARTVNAGRAVAVPTTVGFCMYIRRAALDAVGGFDEAAFGRGYGEENDFCLRAAAAGWEHRLACDTYVFHEGAVSFGAGSNAAAVRAQAVLAARWPGYAEAVARHVRRDPATPFRFALTAALLAGSGLPVVLPVVLLVAHELGGGVRRHMDELVARQGATTRFLLLRAAPSGLVLSVPSLPGHQDARLPDDRPEDIARLLRAAGVSRVHIHHVMGLDLDLRETILRLGVPFDFTLHDYYALCPQVNLLPWGDAAYCGEPGPAGCNACIAARPSHGARDITAWRQQHAWLFHDAARVFCPSEDARARLIRHGLGARAVLAPHEPVPAAPPPTSRTPGPRVPGPREKLRIALLGVLAPQKGAATVASVAEAADPARFAFRLIGAPERDLPAAAARRIVATGAYEEAALPGLIARARPHVAWFPAQWPETYSYTLSAALAAGLPIVASAIGAFPERLAGRALTWLVDPGAPTSVWLDTFAAVRTALEHSQGDRDRNTLRAPLPPTGSDPGAGACLPPSPAMLRMATSPARGRGADRAALSGRHGGAPTDLAERRRGRGAKSRRAVAVLPERFVDGAPTPCAQIRLLQPLDHPAIAAGLDVSLATLPQALRLRADLLLTQRHAVPSAAAAEALAAQCRATGMRLIYDLDDDLLDLPPEHPDAARLAPLAGAVAAMLRLADLVTVSTATLAARVAPLRADAVVVANALDERIWGDPLWSDSLGPRPRLAPPVRLLCMGTATHEADFALIAPALARLVLIAPALARLVGQFGARIAIEVIGVTARAALPEGVTRLAPPGSVASYPAFVHWLRAQPGWDIGLAPLADSAFNACKSPIKLLDYAALGLATVASDTPAYRAALAAGGGLSVANTEAAWCDALSRLIRRPEARAAQAEAGRAWLEASGTLAARAADWRGAWLRPGRVGRPGRSRS